MSNVYHSPNLATLHESQPCNSSRFFVTLKNPFGGHLTFEKVTFSPSQKGHFESPGHGGPLVQFVFKQLRISWGPLQRLKLEDLLVITKMMIGRILGGIPTRDG